MFAGLLVLLAGWNKIYSESDDKFTFCGRTKLLDLSKQLSHLFSRSFILTEMPEYNQNHAVTTNTSVFLALYYLH